MKDEPWLDWTSDVTFLEHARCICPPELQSCAQGHTYHYLTQAVYAVTNAVFTDA